MEFILDCLGCRKGSQIKNILPRCDSECLIILRLQLIVLVWTYTVISLKTVNKAKSTSYLWQAALGIFASFWLFLLRKEIRFGLGIVIIPSPHLGQSLGFLPEDDIQSLCCPVVLLWFLGRFIHFKFFHFLLRTFVLKAKRRDLLSNAHYFQQCWSFDWALHIKVKLRSCFVMCIFVFICLISTWIPLILVAIMKGYRWLSCWHTSSGLADLPSQIHRGHPSFCLASHISDTERWYPMWCLLFYIGSKVGNFTEPGAQKRRCLCTKMAVVGLKLFECLNTVYEDVPIAKTIWFLPWQESVCGIDFIQFHWYLGFFMCQSSSAQFSYGTLIVWIVYTCLRLLL